ncbi:helix-turn-helix domain-containing protein [Lentilactobacillus hilgardii]|uniref:helix-turn-helix domain-containing protein n=1 Tax=Lentilactobacillus hilgardii TaxID=1588 RepID=UPI00390CAB0E
MKIDSFKLLLERGKSGLTIKELSEKAGVSVSTIVHLEHGQSNGSLLTIGKIARAFEIDPLKLIRQEVKS